MTITLNQTTRCQHYGEAYIWRLTSLLVVTLKLTILLSVTHVKRTHFSAIPLRKSVTWLRCMAIASSQAGQLLITFLQTKHAHKHGHMEKQEMEIKRKLEMETGNGNWKWKPETENRNGNATSSLL